MKRKVLLGLSMFSVLLMSCGGEETNTEEVIEDVEVTEDVAQGPVDYVLDVDNSSINWIAYMYDEAAGVDQSGTIKALNGAVTVDGESITSASMDIDMNSILSDGGVANLEGHLKTEDFFDVNNFASSSFSFDKHENGMIYGNVSVIGLDMAIEAPAELIVDDASVTINVSEFRVDMSALPFFIADLENPIEEQHNASVGITATIVATK